MIKPNELRIGNWINEQGVELQVGMINSELFTSAEPILLTKEWLLKFDIYVVKEVISREDLFDKDYYRYIDLSFDSISDDHMNTAISITRRNEKEEELTDVIYFDFEHIKYVHQLQNLYFALTGEELEIKNNEHTN